MAKTLSPEEQARRDRRRAIVDRRVDASHAPDMPDLSVSRVDRAMHYKLDLEERIGDLDRSHSIAEYTALKNGVLVKCITGAPHHVLTLQHFDRVNVFIDPPLGDLLPHLYRGQDGAPRADTYPRVSVQAWHDVTLSDEETAFYKAAGELAIHMNREFFDRQRRWYRDRPWEQLYGLTPAAAVAKLEEMGW